jgi:hypothetical protein
VAAEGRRFVDADDRLRDDVGQLGKPFGRVRHGTVLPWRRGRTARVERWGNGRPADDPPDDAAIFSATLPLCNSDAGTATTDPLRPFDLSARRAAHAATCGAAAVVKGTKRGGASPFTQAGAPNARAQLEGIPPAIFSPNRLHRLERFCRF